MTLYYNTAIVLAGVGLLGALAGLVGSFAVLRKRSLTGDALAHAALPGVCLAFILTGMKSLPVLLIGALASGVVAIITINQLTSRTRIREDAAIGSVLGVFFGCGIALSKWIQNSSRGGKAGIDSFLLGKAASMTRDDVFMISLVAILSVIVIALLYKQFKLISFDSAFGHTLGWPVRWLDLAMMSLLAVTVVIGLPAVGVVLTAAMVIIPGASARFWTNRFGALILLAASFGLAMSVSGALLSAYSFPEFSSSVAHRDGHEFDKPKRKTISLPTGPTIVLCGAAIFVVSLLGGSQRGLIARQLQSRRFRHELQRRRVLEAMWDLKQEAKAKLPGVEFAALQARQAWRPHDLRAALQVAVARGELQQLASGYGLTPQGESAAVQIKRTHLVWHELLQEHPEQASAISDLTAPLGEQVEPELIGKIEQRLRQRGVWPELKEQRA